MPPIDELVLSWWIEETGMTISHYWKQHHKGRMPSHVGRSALFQSAHAASLQSSHAVLGLSSSSGAMCSERWNTSPCPPLASCICCRTCIHITEYRLPVNNCPPEFCLPNVLPRRAT